VSDVDEETKRIMERGFETLADLIRETNERLDASRTELGARVDRVRVELGGQIAQTNGRLDNLILIAGEQTRGLRDDVDALAARMDALEQKVS
jgi:hypothetical protein